MLVLKSVDIPHIQYNYLDEKSSNKKVLELLGANTLSILIYVFEDHLTLIGLRGYYSQDRGACLIGLSFLGKSTQFMLRIGNTTPNFGKLQLAEKQG